MKDFCSIENISIDLSKDDYLSSVNNDIKLAELFCEHFTEDTISASDLLLLDDSNLESLLDICETLALSQAVPLGQEDIFISNVSEEKLLLVESCLSLAKSKFSNEDITSLQVLTSRIECFSKFISNF